MTYPFYILPAIPAIAIGCAYVLTRKWFPREVAYILLGGVFLWFFLYYPGQVFPARPGFGCCSTTEEHGRINHERKVRRFFYTIYAK